MLAGLDRDLAEKRKGKYNVEQEAEVRIFHRTTFSDIHRVVIDKTGKFVKVNLKYLLSTLPYQ